MKTVFTRGLLAANLIALATAASAAPRVDQYAAISRDRSATSAPAVSQEMQGQFHPGLMQPNEPIQVRRTEVLSNY